MCLDVNAKFPKSIKKPLITINSIRIDLLSMRSLCQRILQSQCAVQSSPPTGIVIQITRILPWHNKDTTHSRPLNGAFNTFIGFKLHSNECKVFQNEAHGVTFNCALIIRPNALDCT